MISQVLSVSWQISAKSGASEDFQFQTGNPHTRVKTYATLSAGELGEKMSKLCCKNKCIVLILLYIYSISAMN